MEFFLILIFIFMIGVLIHNSMFTQSAEEKIKKYKEIADTAEAKRISTEAKRISDIEAKRISTEAKRISDIEAEIEKKIAIEYEIKVRAECAIKAGKAATTHAAKQIEKTCLKEHGLKPKGWFD
tara:strand:+ start:771 stop:1142 length:372 start_codon:yes stop_codon:yes gene_type:complete